MQIMNLTLRFEVVTFFRRIKFIEVIYRRSDDIRTLRKMLCFGRVLLVHNRFHVGIHLLHRLNRPITVCIPNILHSDNKLKVLSKIRLSGILAYPNGFSNCRVQGVRTNEELLHQQSLRYVQYSRFLSILYLNFKIQVRAMEKIRKHVA